MTEPLTSTKVSMVGSLPAPADRRIAVGIFFVVLAVYVLTYVGAFKSNDERAMFAGTDSFVKRGRFTVNPIYWDYTNVGMLTSRGDMVPNYEPAQMIATIPLYLWGRALGAGVQGVMFFNALVTAATVALLYLCFLELGYRRRSATLGAFVFAFATLAWPYSRTLFREPLTALAYVLALYGLWRYRQTPDRARWPALTGFALGLALLTKQISVAVIPSLLLLAVVYGREAARRDGVASSRLRAALALLTPLLALLLLGRLYNAVTLGGVELFARNIVEYTTNPQLSQSVPARMWRAAVGITVSPYKGLFWYAPVLLLGLVGAVPFTRRHRWEGIAFLLIIAAHILGYSRYNYWSGGVAWGMRYLLPITPFLVLLAAPVWEWLLPGQGASAPGWRTTAGRVAVWLLIGLSAGIQVLGISVDLRTYELRFLLDNAEIYGGIGQAIEALYLKPAYSPVVGHAQLLLAGSEPLDFAWVQRREMGTWALVPQGLLLSVAYLGLALAGFVWIWRRPRSAGLVAVIMTGVSALVATLLVLAYRQGDARFDTYGVDRFLQPMMQRLAEVSCGWRRCDEVLVVPDPNLTDYFLNYLDAPLDWYGVEPRSEHEALMQHLTSRYRRIWLARDRNAQTDDEEDRRAIERYLAEHAFKVDEQQFDNWARLLRFSAAGRLAEQAAPAAALGDMMLEQVALGLEGSAASEPLDDGVVRAQSGDTLQMSLRWRAAQPPTANYTVFVQLLDANGQVAAQRDRWPGDGLFPTAALAAGQAITDNLALPLDVPPGVYRLIAGLYLTDVEGYPRLSGPGGDFVELSSIQVQP